MSDSARDPNLADIVAVECCDDSTGALQVFKMTEVARAILQRADSFYFTDVQGNRNTVEAWTVYEHPFIHTVGGQAGHDPLLLLPRF